MKRLMKTLVLLTALTSLAAIAQQAMEFDDYMIHYNAFSTSLLTPEIAKAYGIRRSASRALINISVMKKDSYQVTTPAKATVTATGRNLTGQTRNISMREVDNSDGAGYHIGELSVRNLETFDFTVLVTPEGVTKPYAVKFRQQFFTE